MLIFTEEVQNNYFLKQILIVPCHHINQNQFYIIVLLLLYLILKTDYYLHWPIKGLCEEYLDKMWFMSVCVHI